MAPALPHDVWLNIADFLPTLALRALYPVNPSLLHIALDARYRQVSFIYWDDRLLRNLIRLSDPYVARFVKVLYIYPGFLKEVMDREAQSKAREKAKEREKPSFHDRIADITHQLQDKVLSLSRCQADRSGAPETKLHDLPPKTSMRKLREQLKSAQDVMHAVLNLLRSLPSLTDYYITWYGLPTTSFSLTNLAVPCLGAPLLSPSLAKLSLDISLENLDSLCSASFHGARLEHLHLHLHSDHTLSPDSLTFILNARLARSISCLAPYLRLLSIEAHEPVDIGPLLAGLDLLGKLETFALALPLQKPHLGNPKALGRFLRSQAQTIKVLRLRVTQHDAASTGPGSHWRSIGPADPWSLTSWVRTAFGTETGGDFQEWFDEHDRPEPLGEYPLDVLESLELGSNLLPLETAIYCAERFGCKVQTLSLLGGTKSFDFVKELVRVLRGEKKLGSVPEEDDAGSEPESLNVNTNIRTLRLGPISLSPELLDLLAHNLSNLRHLQLIVKHFLPSQDAVPIYGSSRMRGDGDGVQLEEQVYEFLETMQNDWSWPWWGLQTISVYSDSATLSSPLSPPLPPQQSPLPSQETTPTRPLSANSFPVIARSSRVPSLAPSFTSSVTTVTGKKCATAVSTVSTLALPKVSVSAPITRYPTPSTSTPPHPSALLDLPCSYSTDALPLPASPNTEPTMINTESSSPSSLAPVPTLQLSSASTPSSPIGGVSYDMSPVSYIPPSSASTSALPASSSYAYMHDGDDHILQRPATSHEEGRRGIRPSTLGKPTHSRLATFMTSSSPLSTSAMTNTSGSANSSSSSSSSSSSRGSQHHSHNHMFAFLRPGSRLRKEKGTGEKKNVNVDILTPASSSTNSHPAPLPLRSSSNGSGPSTSERPKMRPLVTTTTGHIHSPDVIERTVKNPIGYRSKMGRSVSTTIGDKERGLSSSSSSSRREGELANMTLGSSMSTPPTRIHSLDEMSLNPSAVVPIDDDVRTTNEKARRKEKRNLSSGLYALAVKVRGDHNRQSSSSLSSSSSPHISSLIPSSFPPATIATTMVMTTSSSRQKGSLDSGRMGERVDGEKEMVEWGWEKEKEKDTRRFGSLNSISALSEYSSSAATGGRKSVSDEGDASFTTTSTKDGYNNHNLGGGGGGAGGEEERITLEVALDEILARCLPGVRVVR